MANLPQDLIVSIAQRVVSLEDFISFRAVCKSWSLAAIKENFTRTHQVPWLMLPENKGTTIREFYDLHRDKIYKLDLPQTKDKLCYSSLGWLMTESIKNSKVNLLHPLNRQQIIELPDVEISKNYDHYQEVELIYLFKDFTISKFVLSSSPFTSDYTVLILSWKRLAFWRPGDQGWTILDGHETRYANLYYSDITYYKGQFHAVDELGTVSVCEFIRHPKQAKMRVVVPRMPSELETWLLPLKQYLVESAGALLVIFQFYENTTMFRVFEVPVTDGSWSTASEVKNLGNITLFVGYNNSSFSVNALDHPGCKPNCIYFTNQRLMQGLQHEEVGIFHMEDGKMEPVLNKLPKFRSPYLWIEPSF